jgi:very-short-patch-repair endonuclease
MSSMFCLSRKINKGKKKKKQFKRINYYSSQLNKNLPRSERWFLSLWKTDNIQENNPKFKDQHNTPLQKYIPDIINLGYKYIIEIDGSFHNTPLQKWKDSVKDIFYSNKGFKVFRVTAYNMKSYNETLNSIRKIKEEYRSRVLVEKSRPLIRKMRINPTREDLIGVGRDQRASKRKS